MKKGLTHIDGQGAARMVDVGGKPATRRIARARGFVEMSREALLALERGTLKKGDAIAVARVAGIMAAKKVSHLIPLCHMIPIEYAGVDFKICKTGIQVIAEVGVSAKTGAEMEAVTAASAACLSIYDMCKSVDRHMTIGDICVIEKRGGRHDFKL